LRSYIFTDRERRIVKAFLAGEKVDRLDIGRIMHRVRSFKGLPGDVDLYLALRRLAESKTAEST